MKLQVQDLQFGAVLAQIAEHPTFSSVNKVPGREGLYQVNNYKRLLIKRCGADASTWRFTFRPHEIEEICTGQELFVALVCGYDSICLLSETDLNNLISTSDRSSQSITVESGAKRGFRVHGSAGKLQRVIPHNSFPKELLDDKLVIEEGAWPPLVRIGLYGARPGGALFSTVDRMFDIGGHLLSALLERKEGETLVRHIGISTIDPRWHEWNPTRLRQIERLIKQDITKEGLEVMIERITPSRVGRHYPLCSDEFLWKLTISD